MFTVKEPVGVYQSQQKFLVLLADLTLAVFNSRNAKLERLCDSEAAFKMLRTDDFLEFLQRQRGVYTQALH